MSYDGAVALDFFKAAGKPVDVPQSQVIFAEMDAHESGIFTRKPSKIYFLLAGEVTLMARGKPVGTVQRGEIFGEISAITHAPRTATALAKTNCKLIALDDKELERALAKKPGFALMLMSLLIGRLRDTIARLHAAGAMAEGAEWKEAAAFDPSRMADLLRGLGDDPPIYYQQGQTIMSEGQKGLRMYAVVEGHVTISIGGRVVERLGPGGAFGEAAIIEAAPRMATAVAETDCELLPITRAAFETLVKMEPQFASVMLESVAERLRFLTERLAEK
jgi:CRP/FNR family transcriptional regulator, cyclic AMP receptor protein